VSQIRRPEQPQHADLLTHLSDTAVDRDYARVTAERSAQDRRPGAPVGALAVLALLGVMVALAILQSRSAQPLETAERIELIEQIGEAREEVDAANGRVEVLRAEIDDIQGTAADLNLAGETLLDQVERARILSGKGPVSGPGLRITVDDATHGIEGGTVLDEDLQVLVNGLWLAGAEAIAINGNRLGPLSAIRTAGEAINVNFRPLTPPYVVSAIGDPETLPARFIETAAGQSWADLSTNYGIRFDIETDTALVLPGVPAGRLRMSQAEPGEEQP